MKGRSFDRSISRRKPRAHPSARAGPVHDPAHLHARLPQLLDRPPVRHAAPVARRAPDRPAAARRAELAARVGGAEGEAVDATTQVELGPPNASKGLIEKVDVLAEIPYVIKTMVNYVAGTKPHIYQVRHGIPVSLRR